jgi:hypothetical protein
MSDVKEFFRLVKDGRFSMVEMYNKVEFFTGGFNVDKLKYLLSDFKSYYEICLLEVRQEHNDPTGFWFPELWFLDDLHEIIKEKLGLKEDKTLPKNVWNLYQRYQLIKDLGVVESIELGFHLSQQEKDVLIQQILGCDYTTARKLLGNKYDKGTFATEQEQERNELVSKWSQGKSK